MDTAVAEAHISILSDLELWHICSMVDEAADLLRCPHVSAEWRAQANDPCFWRKMCAKLWTGKAYVPREFIVEADAGELNALPRKAAYFASIRDSRRSELRTEELCAFTWERLRNDADVDLDYMERADPSDVKGDVCHFRPSLRHPNRGLMSSLPGEEGIGMGSSSDMKWLISKLLDRRTQELVTRVSNGPIEQWGGSGGGGGGHGSGDDSDDDDGHYYPPKPVWRTANWGWKCRNHFATCVAADGGRATRQRCIV